MSATRPIDFNAWLRQVLATRGVYGLIVRGGHAGQLPYSESEVWEGPPNASAAGFSWNTLNYAGNDELSIAANPLRKVLIVQNTGPVPIAVSFGITAKYMAGGVGMQGIALGPDPATNGAGDSLYIDRNCPTNAFYIDLNVTGACSVTQGTPGV
jgi:hypothetical protein